MPSHSFVRLAMEVSELTETERKVWQAAATGTLVDLQVGDQELDSPKKWAEWGSKRTVRAEVIAALLIGDGEAASMPVRRVRLQGARITGELNLEATTLRCPLALLHCSVANAISLNEATTVSVRLSGSHVPVVHARQLLTRGDLRLDEGFRVSGEVELIGAHIGGLLVCRGGQFSNPGGRALTADRLTVDGGMYCDEGFAASGEVSLLSAHIGGVLVCSKGQFSNPKGYALNADGLTVDGGMYCDEGFAASGEVSLLGAHIGVLNCSKGQFSNPNPGGRALNADGLVVGSDIFFDAEFVSSGEVRLVGAGIAGQLNCSKGQFSNPDGSALSLERATVAGPLHMESAVLQGILDLTAAKTSSYFDNRSSWPQKLRLDGFVYDAIKDASEKKQDGVKVRLEWLRRNEQGYSPKIYEQLAAVYLRSGHDEDARRILIAKQRRRSAEGNLADKIWGGLLDGLVAYGYRTWQALFWLVALLALGTYLFGYFHSTGDLTPANKPDVQPPFQPFLYTLDLLLPVVNLHVRDAWIAHDAAQFWSVVFIIMGWILATAVVLGLTGLLKRD